MGELIRLQAIAATLNSRVVKKKRAHCLIL
jgi:hypothetical protein